MNANYTEWFRKAQNDIFNIENNLNAPSHATIPYDTVCFHCQQAAEKYLKGYLVKNNVEFSKTHNLVFLLNTCITINPQFEEIRESILILNQYSSLVRYPDFIYEPSKEDALEAYSHVKMVKDFINKLVANSNEK